MNGFSIIICCYNSKKRLKPTLEYLSKLIVPDGYKVEIVLVDNNCSDGSAHFADIFWSEKKSPIGLGIVKEVNSGLTNARIKGIRSSKYDYLIFCDDDNWLFPNYLNIVRENFENHSCHIVGGVGIPISDVEFPDWFKDNNGLGYAIGSENRVDGSQNFIYGAGMAIRKEIAVKYSKLQSTLLLTDRKGDNLSSGGDTEICMIVGLKNVFFDEKLKFYHFLSKDRITIKYFLNLQSGFGEARAMLFFYKLVDFSSNWLAFKIFLFFLFKNCKQLLFLNKSNLNNRAISFYLKSMIRTQFYLLFSFVKTLRKSQINLIYFRDS